jgi:hypothetical protein
MHPKRFIRHLRNYFHHRQIDWTLKRDDVVTTRDWPKPITIIDINWALWAAAVELSPGSIVVWPLWGLRRYEV